MRKNSIVLGFDFGMKYIGVASGQQITNTASPLFSLRAKDGIPDWQEIMQLIAEWKPAKLIVGIPLNMDGSSQQITFCAQKFANRLHECSKLPVEKVDERLSTWEAKNRLYSINKKAKNNFDKLNAAAAVVLVEQWLGANKD